MIRLLFLFLSLMVPLVGADKGPSEEVLIMESLIATSKKSVLIQEKIKDDLIHYQKINKAFLKNPKNPELLVEMLTSAGPLFKELQAFHLIENFSTDFIHELKLFSEIDSKGK